MKNLLSYCLLSLFTLTMYAQPANQNVHSIPQLNYPPVVVNADYEKLPKGSWYYTLCSLPQNGSDHFYNNDCPKTNQVFFVLDDSLRPAYTNNFGPWGMMWNGYVGFWHESDSTLGYNSNGNIWSNGTWGTAQAHGLFPRFKLDPRKNGFVTFDTLRGSGTVKHPEASMDPHGIYLGDSFYVAIQDYQFVHDTGFGFAMMSYKDHSAIAIYSSQDSIDGIPDSQTYVGQCSSYTYPYMGGDFDHPNFIDACGDSIFIVSLRHQNEVSAFKYDKVNKKFKLAWRLRPPLDAFSSFRWLNDTKGFTGQHDVEFMGSDGHDFYISLFDDQECVPNPQSRYMLMKLNLDSMTCEVIKQQDLGFNTGFMGASMAITTSKNIDEIKASPILYTSGGFVDTAFIQETGISIMGIIDTSGSKIAGVKFETDTIRNFFEVDQIAYQARPYNIPLLDQFRPKLITTCDVDSMTISLVNHYDDVYWSTGDNGLQEIKLPRSSSLSVSVAVHNYGTIGEWWAYSSGCAVSTDFQDNGIEEPFDIYPNPSHEIFNIRGNITEKTAFTIKDMDGRLVQSGFLQPQPLQSIHLNSIAQGVYFLSFSSKNHVYVKRLAVI